MGLVAALLAGIGVHLCLRHVESVEREALAAEIESELAARTPPPTDDFPGDSETEELYATAAEEAERCVGPNRVDFQLASEEAPWDKAPPVVETVLQNSGRVYAALRQVLDRPPDQIRDGTLLDRKGMFLLPGLVENCGRAHAARAEWLEAAESVRILRRMARDFWNLPALPGELSHGFVGYGYWCRSKAADLLEDLAERTGLSEEGAVAALAAAEPPWEEPREVERSLPMWRDSYDRSCMKLLRSPSEGPVETFTPEGGLPERVKGVFVAPAGSRRNPTVEEIRTLRVAIFGWMDAASRGEIEPFAPMGMFDRERARWSSGIRMPGGGFTSRWRRRLHEAAVLRVVRAAVAVRAFQLRHGRPPATLRDLVPSVVSEIPVDIFDGNPLTYELEGKGWRIASRIWSGSWKRPDGKEETIEPAEIRFPREAK